MSASKAKGNAVTATAEKELVLTRVLEAPRELVFKVWTDPAHLAQWWGPKGFTNPVCQADARPGGAILIHMRGPDGVVYPMAGTFQEVIEPEKISFVSSAMDGDGNPLFEVLTTARFAAQGAKTRLTLEARVLKSTPQAAPHLAGMEMGWTQSLERLAAYAISARSADEAGTREHSREIVITRLFDAPREMVWDAWTDPSKVAEWWGPRGFTTTIYEMDVRPGGVWRHTMHGPDGTDYPNKSVFKEVVKPERIVFSHGGGKEGGPGVSFEATWTFEAQGKKTRLTMRSVFPSTEARDLAVREYGAIEGGKQTLERLEEQLARMSGSEFLISRVFDAPRELVWEAFTEAARMEQWWGPKGMTTRVARLEPRRGGVFLYSMRAPDGKDWWGRWVYREVIAPERLVTIVSFTDEKGNVVRHPLSPTWPLEVLSIATFAEQGSKTLLTVRSAPINATEEERRTFEEGFKGMEQGFSGTWDQLAEYLAKA